MGSASFGLGAELRVRQLRGNVAACCGPAVPSRASPRNRRGRRRNQHALGHPPTDIRPSSSGPADRRQPSGPATSRGITRRRWPVGRCTNRSSHTPCAACGSTSSEGTPNEETDLRSMRSRAGSESWTSTSCAWELPSVLPCLNGVLRSRRHQGLNQLLGCGHLGGLFGNTQHPQWYAASGERL